MTTSATPESQSSQDPQPIHKTETVFQMEAVECGAASLAMVLTYFGRHVPLDVIRQQCGVGRDGATPAGIERGANAEGLDMTAHSTSPDAAKTLDTPFIAFWDHRHFIAVEGFKDGRWHINDPAAGRSQIKEEAWESGYSNIAMVFSPRPDFQRTEQRRLGTIRALLQPLKGSWGPLILTLVIGFLLTVIPGVLLPSIASSFVDDVLITQSTSLLINIVVGLGLIAGYALIMRLLDMWILMRFGITLAARMSGGLIWHLLQLPTAFFVARQTGGLISRLTDITRLEHTIVRGVPQAIIGGASMVVFFIAIVVQSSVMALVAVIAAGAEFLAVWSVGRIRITASQRLQIGEYASRSKAMEGMRDVENLKARGATGQFVASYMSLQAKNLSSRQKLGRVTTYLATVPSAVNSLSKLSLLTVGALLVIRGDLTIGAVVGIMMLTSRFLSPVGTLVTLTESVQTAHSTLTQINDVMATPRDPNLTRPETDFRRLNGNVTLNNLTFSYTPGQHPNVDNLSLNVKAGESIAITGPSGGGKTTLGNLLAGVLVPDSGTIEFDGIPIEQIARDSLVTQVAKVNQMPYLFAGSVAENLNMWDFDIDAQQMRQALVDAQALDFVEARGGLDSLVKEGGNNFSGGQRQRLEIARALTRNPRVLILDEATSALDGPTEAAVMAALRQREITVISIAHRRNTLLAADRLILIENGELVANSPISEIGKDSDIASFLEQV